MTIEIDNAVYDFDVEAFAVLSELMTDAYVIIRKYDSLNIEECCITDEDAIKLHEMLNKFVDKIFDPRRYELLRKLAGCDQNMRALGDDRSMLRDANTTTWNYVLGDAINSGTGISYTSNVKYGHFPTWRKRTETIIRKIFTRLNKANDEAVRRVNI